MHLDRLRDVRRERGISQRELGERIGVLQARISSIEGGTNVSRQTAERLANALSVGIADLQRPLVGVEDLSPEVLRMLTQK